MYFDNSRTPLHYSVIRKDPGQYLQPCSLFELFAINTYLCTTLALLLTLKVLSKIVSDNI